MVDFNEFPNAMNIMGTASTPAHTCTSGANISTSLTVSSPRSFLPSPSAQQWGRGGAGGNTGILSSPKDTLYAAKSIIFTKNSSALQQL